jgi:hypothetical protein
VGRLIGGAMDTESGHCLITVQADDGFP